MYVYFRHIVTKALSAENMTIGSEQTFGENPQTINIKKVDGNVQVEFDGNTATVKTPDIIAKNGIIHEVTAILLEPSTPAPTEDLIQVLTKRGNFGKLIEAVTKSGLTDKLKAIGVATFFAPNDEAFKKLPEGTTIESLTAEELEKIISR